MDNGLNKIQLFIQQNIGSIMILMIVQIIFISIFAFIISNINKDNHQVSYIEIAKLTDQINNLPSSSSSAIEEMLYNTVISNKGDIASISESDATIRDGSLVNRYFDQVNMHYVNFIVDFPGIEQSYQIFHEWSNDNNNSYYLVNNSTLVMCLPESKTIYTAFDCRDKLKESGRSLIVSEFLSYFEFQQFSISTDQSKPTEIRINPIDMHASDETKTSYTNSVRDAVLSLGFDPNEFTYYVTSQKDMDYQLYNS